MGWESYIETKSGFSQRDLESILAVGGHPWHRLATTCALTPGI